MPESKSAILEAETLLWNR